MTIEEQIDVLRRASKRFEDGQREYMAMSIFDDAVDTLTNLNDVLIAAENICKEGIWGSATQNEWLRLEAAIAEARK